MLKKLLFVLVLGLSVLGLTGCSKELTGTGYGLVHGHYVGIVTVVVEDDVVVDMTLEEYFLPYSWAKVANVVVDEDRVPVTALPDDQFFVAGVRNANNAYAKYIKIGDKLFTGSAAGNVGSQTPLYAATGIADIEEWVKVEANAKWYVEQVDAEAFFIATATGTAHATYTTISTDASTTSMKKSLSGYWVVDAPRLGWAGNSTATIEAIKGLNLSEEFDLLRDPTTVAGSQFWSIDGAVTGATWSDFPDYFAVAVRAYKNAK